jgi:hypothetical protein
LKYSTIWERFKGFYEGKTPVHMNCNKFGDSLSPFLKFGFY